MLNNKKGFTLVELLVVISIIALLLAILMPSLNKARRQVKFIVCLNNMKQLGISSYQYAIDHDGYILPSQSNGTGSSVEGDSNSAYPIWYERLRNLNYLKFQDDKAAILHCPEDKRGKFYCSYASNRYVMGLTDDYTKVNVPSIYIKKISSIKNASEVILLGERSLRMEMEEAKIGGYWSAWGTSVWAFSSTEDAPGTSAAAGFDWRVHASRPKIDRMSFQNGAGPLVMVDGHAEAFRNLNFDCDGRGGLRWTSPDGLPKMSSK